MTQVDAQTHKRNIMNALMPLVAKTISSDALLLIKRRLRQWQRQVSGRHATLDIFLAINDPYSYLLIQILPSFMVRFNVSVKFHTVLDLQPEMFPAPILSQLYAVHDANHLAKLYALDFPKNGMPKTDKKILEQATALLVQAESADYLVSAQTIYQQFWHNKFEQQHNASLFTNEKISQRLHYNQQLLTKKGHYMAAMIHFEGEWYWGLDRLDHLERRLITKKMAFRNNEEITYNRTYQDFCAQNIIATAAQKIETTLKKPLTLYWSARSPYSYIALERAIKLCQHYRMPLSIKPILPMVMRGMKVPSTKKMYIFLDTKREAKKLGLPYGFVADPLGAGVDRCYALLDYAQSKKKLPDYLLSFSRAVNTQGIRSDTDSGMKIIVERCGLNWLMAKSKLSNTDWQQNVDNNLNELLELGCWGVPCFDYNNMIFWGQDRIAFIEQEIKNELSIS